MLFKNVHYPTNGTSRFNYITLSKRDEYSKDVNPEMTNGKLKVEKILKQNFEISIFMPYLTNYGLR